jgi:uncharacterized protein (DUF1697 family)
MTSEKFRTFFLGLGFAGVRVVLGSGNIIFESPSDDVGSLAKRIEEALPIRLGFSRSVVIRSEAELQHIIDQDPYKGMEQDHNKAAYLLVTFFRYPPIISLEFPYSPAGKSFTLLGRIDDAIYGSVDLTTGKTPDYMAWLEKQFGRDITSRTIKTIRLILSKMHKS